MSPKSFRTEAPRMPSYDPAAVRDRRASGFSAWYDLLGDQEREQLQTNEGSNTTWTDFLKAQDDGQVDRFLEWLFHDKSAMNVVPAMFKLFNFSDAGSVELQKIKDRGGIGPYEKKKAKKIGIRGTTPRLYLGVIRKWIKFKMTYQKISRVAQLLDYNIMKWPVNDFWEIRAYALQNTESSVNQLLKGLNKVWSLEGCARQWQKELKDSQIVGKATVERPHHVEVDLLPFFEEIVMQEVNPTSRCILLLLLELGIRQEDLMELKWQKHLEVLGDVMEKKDITWRKMWGLPKPSEEHLEALKGFYGLGDHLFQNKTGKKRTPVGVTKRTVALVGRFRELLLQKATTDQVKINLEKNALGFNCLQTLHKAVQRAITKFRARGQEWLEAQHKAGKFSHMARFPAVHAHAFRKVWG